MSKVESIMYPPVAITIEDISSGDPNKKPKSPITMPANEYLPSRSFNYGNWRKTDARGLIRDVACKEKDHTVEAPRQKPTAASTDREKWPHGKDKVWGYGFPRDRPMNMSFVQSALREIWLYNEAMKHEKDFGMDCGVSSVVEDDAVGVDGIKDGSDGDIKGAESEAGDMIGSEEIAGTNKVGCFDRGECKKRKCEVEDGIDAVEGIKAGDSGAEGVAADVVKDEGDGHNKATDKDPRNKNEEVEAGWDRCSYPHTRLF